ncbi:hypothetical protein [Streptomyces rubiginosohelvolus]|uniref:hypothetical protein n=1 Tax=Streptomyces rubiginosohelvolus TaxID=67362 RepID=UPI00367AA2BB
MRRQTYGSTGRRGTAIAASAAALCLGTGLLSGCGSGPGDGYTAVGAAAGSSKPPSDGAPSGDVTLTPLDGSGGSGGGGTSPSGGTSPGPGTSPGAGSPGAGRSGDAQDGSGDAQDGSGGARTGTPGGRQAAGSSGGPGSTPAQPADPSAPSKPGGGGAGNPSPPGPGSPGTPSSPKPPAPPATPAALTLSAPQRAAADKRWCEKVTVEFRNTGGSPARSGTVTFATHIIGALGVDWATITSSQPLPAPIDARSTRSKTYTVCVESWRVPLGMRVETQDVSAVWE